jgi:phosphopentomutase
MCAAPRVPARRAIVLVIDACGVGALPDARQYGDEGVNTLAHVAEAVGGLSLPTLTALGLGSILPLQGVPAAEDPVIHGRLHALGPGKDSATGHWELMGVVSPKALPTYPAGFPPAVTARLRRAIGREVICNSPCDGIAAIEQFGSEHLRTGALIAYTSQDSVLQLAAHVERMSAAELYAACAAARRVMSGEHAVGRVIARPFSGPQGAFRRTEGRRDYTVPPPGRSYLEELEEDGVEVHGVGKVSDLFAGVGITQSHAGTTNARALASVDALLGELEQGLVLVNLIETDQVHGHRKDVHGFHRALREIDSYLARRLAGMRAGDLLIVTADHGVDPTRASSDHTREYAPLLAVSGEMVKRRARLLPRDGPSARRTSPGPGGAKGRGEAAANAGGTRHDGPLADVGATALRWLTGRDAERLPGQAFLT